VSDLHQRLRERSAERELEARLGLFDATTMGVGALMGAGLYVLVGIAAAEAGPSLWAAYLACGVLTLLSVWMYGDLAARLPVAGGGYIYAYRTLGSFWGFMVGWNLAVGSVFACALYAIGFAWYFGSFLPEAWAGPVLQRALSAGIAVGLTALALRGGRGGVRAQRWFTWSNVAVVLVLALAALTVARGENFSPALPNGMAGIGGAISLVYLSFFGYQLIANSAEEVRDAPRTVPRAMLLAMLVAMGCYVFTAAAAVAAVPWTELAESEAPLVLVAGRALGVFGTVLVGVGGVLASLGALNSTLVAQSRQIYAMGRDRMLPALLGEVNEGRGVPVAATLAGAAAVMVVVLMGDPAFIARAANFALIFSMMPLSVALHRLFAERREAGEAVALWRRLVPWAALVANAALLMTLDFASLTFGGTLVAAGCLAFFTYSHSSERRGQAGLSVALAKRDRLDLPWLRRGDRVLVPVANPETQGCLMSISQGLLPPTGGEVVALSVVEAADGVSYRQTLQQSELTGPAVLAMERMLVLGDELGVTVQPLVRAARDLAEGISHAAAEEACRVVVMGWSAADEASPSSLLEAVMERTRSDFVFVASRRKGPLKRVGVPLASARNLDLMGKVAAALAADQDGEIVYLTVVPRHFEIGDMQQARYAQIQAMTRHSFLLPWRSELIRSDNPYEAILERSRSLDALVIGSAAADPWQRCGVGAFSSMLANNADCSVVVVRTAVSLERVLPTELGSLRQLADSTLRPPQPRG